MHYTSLFLFHQLTLLLNLRTHFCAPIAAQTVHRSLAGRSIPQSFALIFLLTVSEVSVAHGFGEQLDLKIPLWLWLGGAALTVLLSFAVVIDFLPEKFTTTQYWRRDVTGSLLARLIFHPINLWLARILLVALLLLAIAIGFFGSQAPGKNPVPMLVWIAFWVGMTFSVSFLGNFWRTINPFATLYFLLFRSVTLQEIKTEDSNLSQSTWAAVILLIVFMFVEHLWPHNEQPIYLAVLILAYVGFTLFMMKRRGPANWLHNGEIFSIVFEIFGRFAPIKFILGSADKLSILLRPPALGLLDNRPTPTPVMVFVFVLLAGVTFDGLMDIPQWQSYLFSHSVTLSDYLDINLFMVLGNFCLLLLLPALFFLLFWLACIATRHLLQQDSSANSWMLMQSYVMTLIPIAIAYHFVHYLSLLLVEGQLLIPLLSDPFSLGWNIFGSKSYQPDASFFSSKFMWYFAVTVIVVGHMLSVYLAHLVTLTFSDNKSTAVKAGAPILLLMVFYTVISLWVIAQPAVSA